MPAAGMNNILQETVDQTHNELSPTLLMKNVLRHDHEKIKYHQPIQPIKYTDK